VTQLRLFQRPATERRRVLEARHGWTARNALANRPRSTWPRGTFPTVSEAPPSAPRPADAALLVLGALPTPWAEMTSTAKDAWSLAFVHRLNEQRAAHEARLDALADSGS